MSPRTADDVLALMRGAEPASDEATLLVEIGPRGGYRGGYVGTVPVSERVFNELLTRMAIRCDHGDGLKEGVNYFTAYTAEVEMEHRAVLREHLSPPRPDGAA